MVTLAKTLGGGLPSGAIGGTEEVMSVVEDGTVYQVGTFNGNPLTMAAAKASLLEVLTPDAYSTSTGSTSASWPAARTSSTATACPATASGSEQGLRHVRGREDHRLRDVQEAPGRRLGGSRLALQPEPRDLHDAWARGGVDALDRSHRGSRGRLRRLLRRDGARPDGLTRITVTVSPGASRTELVGRHGDGWRARVAAAPERGKANEALGRAPGRSARAARGTGPGRRRTDSPPQDRRDRRDRRS